MARIDQQIRRARLESGLSQEALAERIGVPPAALNRYEQGEQISSRHLELIAVATGKPLSYFFQAEEDDVSQNGFAGRLRAALAWLSAPAVDQDQEDLLAEVAARERSLAVRERHLAELVAGLEQRERALNAREEELEAKAELGRKHDAPPAQSS